MKSNEYETGQENVKSILRIKDVLKEKGITYQQLADMMGISLQSVRMTLCKDSVNTSTLAKIATVLQVPLWSLLASPADVRKELGEASVFGVITVGNHAYRINSLQDLERATEQIKDILHQL